MVQVSTETSGKSRVSRQALKASRVCSKVESQVPRESKSEQGEGF